MAPTARQYGIGLASLAGIAALGAAIYTFAYGPQINIERKSTGSTSFKGVPISYQVSETNAGDDVLKFCLDGDKNCVTRSDFVENWSDSLDAKLREEEAKK